MKCRKCPRDKKNLRSCPYQLVQANIFVHFIPLDHDEMNEKDRVIADAKKPLSVTDRLRSVFTGFSRKQLIGGHEQDNHDEVRDFGVDHSRCIDKQCDYRVVSVMYYAVM